MASDYYNTTAPGISFSRKRGEIFIYHTTVEALGYPCFVRFLMDPNRGRLALQRCEKKELETFVVPEYGFGEWQFRIYSENMSRIIWKRFGWEKDRTYRCLGISYPKYKLVEFDLTRAELEQEEAVG